MTKQTPFQKYCVENGFNENRAFYIGKKKYFIQDDFGDAKTIRVEDSSDKSSLVEWAKLKNRPH